MDFLSLMTSAVLLMNSLTLMPFSFISLCDHGNLTLHVLFPTNWHFDTLDLVITCVNSTLFPTVIFCLFYLQIKPPNPWLACSTKKKPKLGKRHLERIWSCTRCSEDLKNLLTASTFSLSLDLFLC